MRDSRLAALVAVAGVAIGLLLMTAGSATKHDHPGAHARHAAGGALTLAQSGLLDQLFGPPTDDPDEGDGGEPGEGEPGEGVDPPEPDDGFGMPDPDEPDDPIVPDDPDRFDPPQPGPETQPRPDAGRQPAPRDFDSPLDTGEPPTDAQRSLWEDFNHYVRIARPELAADAGAQLLNTTSAGQLLSLAESGLYRDYQRTLERAVRIESLRPIAESVGERIESARMERSRDPSRIAENLRRLALGPRPAQNALRRLRAAGQYAAPQMLRVLEDPDQADLQPYVLNAMVAIGRPLVNPLSEALPEVDDTLAGRLAQVLAQIGYRQALPALKARLDMGELSPEAQRTVQAAFEQLADTAGLPYNLTAAELYLALARNYYEAGTRDTSLPGFDPATESGVVWNYRMDSGLIAVPVPAKIYADVLAMRAAQDSLRLNPEMAPALTVWLASNLRRENQLGPGETDPSYPSEYREAGFYLRLAGPLRQHEVLDTALADNDPPLALDAIAALADTAGSESLAAAAGTMQPLVEALGYPDRRVRFEAAQALAGAGLSESFPGIGRVIAVLGEAVRQSDRQVALLLAPTQDEANRLAATFREFGFETIAGVSLDDPEVRGQIATGPGVDLIVARGGPAEIRTAYNRGRQNFKLVGAPILGLIDADDSVLLNRWAAEAGDAVQLSLAGGSESELRTAMRTTMQAAEGSTLSAEQAERYAVEALDRLRELALSAGVDQVREAEPALIQALGDTRGEVVRRAANVLALLDSDEAQRNLAETALAIERSQPIRIAMFNALAESANAFGNMLLPRHDRAILELVGSDVPAPLANAAARAHGALTLPTEYAVELLMPEADAAR